MAGKRIFVAIDLSEEARNRVTEDIENLRREFRHLRVGWTTAEKLHLTLKFAGHISDEQLTALRGLVENTAVVVPKFIVRIGGTGAFVRRGRSGVLWLGVEADSPRDFPNILGHIAATLDFRAAEFGIEREPRGFTPHLTIARLKDPRSSRDLVKKHLNSIFAPVEFDAGELVIYESDLLPAGSVYTVVSKAKLEG